MSEQDPIPNEEHPEDQAGAEPESNQEPAKDATPELEASQSPEVENEQVQDAGDLAEEALRAAQDAVSEIEGSTDESQDESESEVEDPAAAAALEAVRAAIAMTASGDVSKPAAQPEVADSTSAPAVATASPAAPSVPQPEPQTLGLPAFDLSNIDTQAKGIDLLADVNLNVKIELGRTMMLVEDVLRLSEGAVVELDKLAGDPVDIYVNDRPIARGEVLVLNDNFCVRINEIITDESGSQSSRAAS